MSLEDKVEILLDDPDCFYTFTYAQYLEWSQEIAAYLAKREPRSARKQSIRKAHSAVAKRLKNREYARQRRLLKNDYVRSLEGRVADLTNMCHDLTRRLELLQNSHGAGELYFILGQEQNLN